MSRHGDDKQARFESRYCPMGDFQKEVIQRLLFGAFASEAARVSLAS